MLPGGCLDIARVDQHDHEEGRGDGERENGIGDAVEQHDGGHADEREDAHQQIDQAVSDEFLDIGNVAGDALHEVAFFLLAVPVEGDTLQVFKQLFAQPRAQALRDVGGQEEIEPGQRRAESGENNKDDDREDDHSDHAVMRNIGIDQRARVGWIGRAGRGRRRHRIMASRRRIK